MVSGLSGSSARHFVSRGINQLRGDMQPEYGLFYFKRQLSVGWIVEHQGGQCKLELPGGQRVAYPADQLLYRWKDEPAATGGAPKDSAPKIPADAVGAMVQLKARRGWLATIRREELNALHRKLPKGVETSFTQIARIALSGPRGLPKDGADGWSRARLFWGLLNSPGLFRPTGRGFAARNAVERRQWETQQQAARARAQWRLKVGRWRETLQSGGRPRGRGAALFMAQLESLLMEERRSPHWELLAQPLGLRRGKTEETKARLRGWLEAAGCWPGWPALWLKGSGVAARFPQGLAASTEKLAGQKTRRKERTDYRKLETFTIDAAGSKDLDDAVSILAADARGLTIAVHIAQPPPSLRPGHPLFAEAARRGTSVYIPQAVFPMLPPSLSKGRFSLLAGKEREVVSFILRITQSRSELVKVEQALIRVKRNLDYARADRMVAEAHGEWHRLGELCQGLRAARDRKGARIGERIEVLINASKASQVRLETHHRGGPAQLIVEELAVLLNREAGRYCRRHGLPAIYRVQPRPTSERGNTMPRAASFSIRGAAHAGLGCDRYIQITSPIRRFPDLLMQQQIAGHALRGRVTYADASQLQAWAGAADERMAACAELEGRIKDYWKRRFMAQQGRAGFSGIVRRVGGSGKGRVWLEAIQLLVHADLPGNVKTGEKLKVRIALADPENHLVRVVPV